MNILARKPVGDMGERLNRAFRPEAVGAGSPTLFVAFIAYTASIPLGAVRPESTSGFTIAFVFSVIFGLVACFHARKCFAPPNTALWFLLAYLYVQFISLFSIAPQYSSDAWYRFLSECQFWVLAWITSNLCKDRKYYLGLLWSLGVATGMLSLLHLAGVGRTALQEGRESGFGQDLNLFAAILCMGLIALLGLTHGRRDAKWWLPFVTYPLCIAIAVDMARSGSRAGILAVAIGIPFVALVKESPGRMAIRIAGVCAILIAVGGVMLQSPVLMERINRAVQGDSSGRDIMYPNAIKMIKERPLMGWGPIQNQVELLRRSTMIFHGPEIHDRYDTHNEVLGVLTENGILGFIPFVAALTTCFIYAWRARGSLQGSVPLAILVVDFVSNMGSNQHTVRNTWLGWSIAAGAAFAAGWYRPQRDDPNFDIPLGRRPASPALEDGRTS